MSTALKQTPERRHVSTEPVFKQRFSVVRVDHQLAEGTEAPATGDILKDVVVVQAGEAKGHGVFLEQAFVDKIVELGNASPTGIKARFDHPGRCETEFGWQIGTLHNFRVEDDRAIADLHLSESAKKSPHGDLHAYILAAAAEHPDKFGNSIVFDQGETYTYAPDGTRVTEDDYYNEKRDWVAGDWYVMPAALHACDVVDEPAATSGFFSRMFSQAWAKPLASLLKLPEVEAFAKQFPKVYKGLYSTQNMKTKKFDIGAVTDTGARLVVVTDAEQIAPGDAVNVVAEDGTVTQAPPGPHLIVESDSGQTGTIVVDDMGVIQEMTDGLAATEDPAAAPGGDGEEKTGDVAALSAQIRDLRTQLAAKDAAFEQRLAAIEKGQTTFGNQLKSLFTRLKIVEAQPAGTPLPGAGSDARGAGKFTSLMDNPWNQDAEKLLG